MSGILEEMGGEGWIELGGEGLRLNDVKGWKGGKVVNNVVSYVGKRKGEGNVGIVYGK